MNNNKWKRITLAVYFALILYCMFWGFGRTARFDSYQFSIEITRFPLWFPKHFSPDILRPWVFLLGNLMAFIPFGVLIPWNFPFSSKSFAKSTAIFVAGITVLEILQMLTRLGSFDTADILINTIGFGIGYASWKISRRGNGVPGKVLRFLTACGVLVILTIAGGEGINALLDSRRF